MSPAVQDMSRGGHVRPLSPCQQIRPDRHVVADRCSVEKLGAVASGLVLWRRDAMGGTGASMGGQQSEALSGQTDRQTDTQTHRQTDTQTHRQTDGHTGGVVTSSLWGPPLTKLSGTDG